MQNCFADQLLREFSDNLASSAPVPGGGGASALCGALGTALGSMVANLTLGKSKYADFEPQVRELIDRAQVLRAQFLEAIDSDAHAFLPLRKAYALPKDAPDRDTILQACLADAAQAPLDVMRLCAQGLELHQALLGKTTLLAVSDIGTGSALLWGAMQGAAMNVMVNANLMTDRQVAALLRDEVLALLDQYGKLAAQLYHTILEGFSCVPNC